MTIESIRRSNIYSGHRGRNAEMRKVSTSDLLCIRLTCERNGKDLVKKKATVSCHLISFQMATEVMSSLCRKKKERRKAGKENG